MKFTDLIRTGLFAVRPSLVSVLRPRLHAACLLPLGLFFVAVLVGPAHGAAGAVMPSTVEGHAQFYKAPTEGLLEAQDCQLTRGRVTAYQADGFVVAKGRLSPSGSFVLTKPPKPVRWRKRGAGLAGGEIRVVIDLPDGSMLMADSNEKFIHVSPLTTILSLARKNRPSLTLSQAEAALRSYFDLPESQSLEDFGGELSPFSEADFMAAARAWNAEKKKPREDIDAFVNEVEDGVQDHVDGQLSAIEPFRSTIAAAPLLGIEDDNTDSPGSLDPDQHQGLAGESVVFDPNIFKQKDNLGLANSIVNSVCSSISNIGAFAGILDAAAGQNDAGSYAKWGGGIGITSVVAQMLSSIVLAILENNAPDPVTEGLKHISAQIEALSQQLKQTQTKILFTIEKQKTQSSYDQLLARLNTVSTTLRPASTAPQSAGQFQQSCQSFVNTPAVGAQASITLANSMLGISGSDNGVRLFHAMITSDFDMTPGGPGDRMNLPFRSNIELLKARNMPMRYVNMLTTALQVSAEESRVYLNFYGSPAQRLNGLQDSFEQATPAFGNNGLAALRRRALQQAPPRLGSSEIFVDCTRGDTGRGLVWSREVMVRKFDETTTQRKDTYTAFICYVDGEKFKPGDYRLNDELPASAGWRLPALQELQSLSGWGKGVDGLAALSGQTGINRGGPRWFAAQDPSAPDPIGTQETGFGTVSKSYVKGRVRFYSYDQGREVRGVEASEKRGNVVACLRVLDLNTYPGNADMPTFAWPDDPARKPSWWPAKAYESSLMRAAGIPPTDIAIVDHVIPNPWYKETPLDPREVPTHVRALSALAYWELKSVGSETRGMVEDVSGLVEWQSSDSGAAMVGNTYSRFDAASEAARSDGKFVSPWFAPITFSRADVPVTFTANWIQQLASATPSNKLTITQASDASLCLPPLVCGLDVTPGNLKYIRAGDINDKVAMSATLYRNDRSAEDATNEVVWSLLSVTKDANGNEITTPFSAELASISQGSGGGTGGKLTVQPEAGLPARTLRVLATDPATGRTGKADLLLQF
ncbi:MAG: hypothetical protein JHC85_04350 [Chthoniobacterales bacterium]|nr:hypothetical protein [Chthoniobacterales bacterium]